MHLGPLVVKRLSQGGKWPTYKIEVDALVFQDKLDRDFGGSGAVVHRNNLFFLDLRFQGSLLLYVRVSSIHTPTWILPNLIEHVLVWLGEQGDPNHGIDCRSSFGEDALESFPPMKGKFS